MTAPNTNPAHVWQEAVTEQSVGDNVARLRDVKRKSIVVNREKINGNERNKCKLKYH